MGAVALNLWSNLLSVNVVQQYLAHSGLGSTRIKEDPGRAPRWMSLSSLQPNGGGGCGR